MIIVSMSAVETLENRVSEKSIRIIQIVGVPRSMSTALGRALNESEEASYFLNEPFNRDNQDINIAAQHILKTAEMHSPKDTSVTIITKNMASYMSNTVFREMADISSDTLWAIRDPLIQMGSLLTRLVNDIYVRPGSSTIPQEHIGPYLEGACSFLQESSKSHNYSKTGWESIGNHFKNIAKHKIGSIVDGSSFSASPGLLLEKICGDLDLPYNPSMTYGWKNNFINVINLGEEEETYRSAWTNQAANSLGVFAVSRARLMLEDLPKGLQKHMTDIAIPTYQNMTVR
jgi:hypothetical protein